MTKKNHFLNVIYSGLGFKVYGLGMEVGLLCFTADCSESKWENKKKLKIHNDKKTPFSMGSQIHGCRSIMGWSLVCDIGFDANYLQHG